MNNDSNSTENAGGSALEEPKPVNDDCGEKEDKIFSAIDKRLEALLARVNELESTLTKFHEASDVEINDDEVDINKSPSEVIDGSNEKKN